MRVYVFSFFCLIAFGVTYKTIATPGHHAFAAWAVVGLLWLIAIAATIDAVRPRRGRQWTGFVASGAFGALAIMAAVAVIRNGDHKAYGWFFSLLFASLSGIVAVVTVRDGKREARDLQRVGFELSKKTSVGPSAP